MLFWTPPKDLTWRISCGLQESNPGILLFQYTLCKGCHKYGLCAGSGQWNPRTPKDVWLTTCGTWWSWPRVLHVELVWHAGPAHWICSRIRPTNWPSALEPAHRPGLLAWSLHVACEPRWVLHAGLRASLDWALRQAPHAGASAQGSLIRTPHAACAPCWL